MKAKAVIDEDNLLRLLTDGLTIRLPEKATQLELTASPFLKDLLLKVMLEFIAEKQQSKPKKFFDRMDDFFAQF